ncbi:hypothetical protein LINPERHAP2_LOCUS41944, partial [Linum perenne]
VVENGSRWRIGNGTSVKVWTDTWIRDEVSFKTTTPTNMDFADLTVHELAIPCAVKWDVNHIELMFNERDMTLILSMPPSNPRRTDKLVWNFSRNG